MERCSDTEMYFKERIYTCDICGNALKTDYILMNVMRCDNCLCKPVPRCQIFIYKELVKTDE